MLIAGTSPSALELSLKKDGNRFGSKPLSSIGFYQVELMFLQLPSAELAVERVRQRVAQGGHNIPERDIRRRFERGIANFNQLYRSAVDAWQVFDASQWPPVLIDNGVNS